MEESIETDLKALLELLPPHIAEPLVGLTDKDHLLEIILDLGRTCEARYLERTCILSAREVTEEDIQYVIQRIGSFGGDNRAGIERTLHRISAIPNRSGKIVGLTLRVGRAVYGTIKIIEDLILTGKSVLLLGRPGVGKTTMLREVARVLADHALKRVIVVDTSNEIAGDGDIPHPGIGHARRMQVHSPDQQHSVMIEAVENHMPEVIVIDEIGTELEANAARTIAERGVQLVATAHGNTLDNLVLNPTLSDLVGGVHTVTLGDDEARRRRTQKSVQERMAPPTFEVLVEIQGWNQVAIHTDVAEVVDHMLRGYPVKPEFRSLDNHNNVHSTLPARSETDAPRESGTTRRFDSQPRFVNNQDLEELTHNPDRYSRVTRILPYGVNKGKLQQCLRITSVPVKLVDAIEDADLLLTTKNFFRRRTQILQEAEEKNKPVFVLRKNTTAQIQQFFKAITRDKKQQGSQEKINRAIEETEEAIDQINNNKHQQELGPQGAYIRHLQHQIAEENGLASASAGREPRRRVIIRRP